MKKRMQESYTKGLAIHSDPESCVCHREVAGEALTGAHTGAVLSRVNKDFGAPTLLLEAEGNMEGVDIARRLSAPRGLRPAARVESSRARTGRSLYHLQWHGRSHREGGRP